MTAGLFYRSSSLKPRRLNDPQRRRASEALCQRSCQSSLHKDIKSERAPSHLLIAWQHSCHTRKRTANPRWHPRYRRVRGLVRGCKCCSQTRRRCAVICVRGAHLSCGARTLDLRCSSTLRLPRTAGRSVTFPPVRRLELVCDPKM